MLWEVLRERKFLSISTRRFHKKSDRCIRYGEECQRHGVEVFQTKYVSLDRGDKDEGESIGPSVEDALLHHIFVIRSDRRCSYSIVKVHQGLDKTHASLGIKMTISYVLDGYKRSLINTTSVNSFGCRINNSSFRWKIQVVLITKLWLRRSV